MTKLQGVPPGPWDDEPDEHMFIHKGRACAVKRTMGPSHWCGYASVKEGHPLYEVDTDRLDVHGGVTFAARGQKDFGVNDEHLWWFGFYCAHYGDLMPGNPIHPGSSYKNYDFVINETKRLADQLDLLAL